MKNRLLLLIFGCCVKPLNGDHLTLNKVSKCEFMECRLEMVESLFRLKKEELKRCERNFSADRSPEKLQNTIIRLRSDIRSLAQSLPILRNSLHALRST